MSDTTPRTVIAALSVAVALTMAGCANEAQEDSQRPMERVSVDQETLTPARITEAESVDIYLSAEGFRNVQRIDLLNEESTP